MGGKRESSRSTNGLAGTLALALVLALLPATTDSTSAAPPRGPETTPARFSKESSGSALLTATRQEFLQGYRAEQQGDLAQAAQTLEPLVGRYPELGDYVLFYLGRAQSGLSQLSAAAFSFERLLRDYPQSVLAHRGELELAKTALKQGQFARAEQTAAHLLPKIAGSDLEPDTRVVLASALIGTQEIRAANTQLDLVRREFPRSASDAKARALQNGLRKLYPDLIGLHTASDFKNEAELLLKEGLFEQALAATDNALALAPGTQTLAELLWVEARAAAHTDRNRQKRALDRYLEVAPNGAAAPQVAYALGLWYWHVDQTGPAASWFSRVARDFPDNPLASQAMLRIGRIAEEEHDLNRARLEYQRLAARYPQSEAGVQAKFRAIWMLYMSGDYRAAAEQFGKLRAQTPVGSLHDKFGYWEARAWEKLGQRKQAQACFEQVAQSLASNYYPALAARKTAERPPLLAAAAAGDLVAPDAPRIDGAAGFHLTRVNELAALGLKRLMAGELLALSSFANHQQNLRDFVLVKLQAADDYYDAIMVAMKMEQRGELSPSTAERLRYPRAYWDWVTAIGARAGVEPYLLLAVARQESLFNPHARSGSDARGLMQLLPATAVRLARRPREQIDLYDPKPNLELGALELKRLLNRFDGDVFKATAAYNAGEQAVERWNVKHPGNDDDEWVENIEYNETRRYVKRVIGGLREYRMLYGPATRGFAFNRIGAQPAASDNIEGD
jgi:soluble lytic murein transglycosylase-like protein/outer membrane protein assembly factor BamD (BamD/ComL family)